MEFVKKFKCVIPGSSVIIINILQQKLLEKLDFRGELENRILQNHIVNNVHFYSRYTLNSNQMKILQKFLNGALREIFTKKYK